MYASLDKSAQPKSFAITSTAATNTGNVLSQHQHYQTQAATPSQKHKKLRHRRVGSGGGGGGVSTCILTKSSPIRDRRHHPVEHRKSRLLLLVDSQTQTDQTSIMDMSETDASPSPFATSRELAMCLRDSGRGRSIEDLNLYGSDYVDAEIYDDKSASSSAIKNEEYAVQQATAASAPATSATATSPLHSPNGNSMSKSDLTYQDACSSPDLLDDAMNSNDRLDDDLPPINGGESLHQSSTSSPSPPNRPTCQRRSSRGGNRHHRRHNAESEDNLEQLDRQVNAFFTENRRSIQSSNSENGNNAPATGVLDALRQEALTTMITATSTTTGVDASNAMITATTMIGEKLDIVDDLTMRRGYIHMNKDGNEVTVIRCTSSQDEFCNDSWTDEEGEDPDNQYSWRRKR